MSLKSLKLDFNRVKEENKRYKTRNAQLETLINALYDDLHEQQNEIEKIYSGKSVLKPEFLQSTLVQGLKREIREARTMNKLFSDDIERLKKSVRNTNAEELQFEVKFLNKECQRLNKLLRKELKKGERNVQKINAGALPSYISEEDKRHFATTLT